MGRNTMRNSINNAMQQRNFSEYLKDKVVMKTITYVEDKSQTFNISETLFDYLFEWDYIFTDGEFWLFDNLEAVKEKVENFSVS